MDVSNDHLKQLLEQTDTAFKALLKEPNSYELNDRYERAKDALNAYVMRAKVQLNDNR